MKTSGYVGACMLLALAACAGTGSFDGPQSASVPPKHRVDAAWPKPLPNNWILGQVSGIAVDSRDHVWIVHRPTSILKEELGAAQKPSTSKCCVQAPAVIEFDPEGNVVQGWGGAAQGGDWPKNEHGIHVDREGNVWLGANDPTDNHVLKFTRDGKFLMQIGKPGKSEGSNSQRQLGRPAHMDTDLQANEVFIADGYGNRRVAVFDAKTGAYKRHWGAYGGIPNDEKLPPFSPTMSGSESFYNPVHCVRLSHDGHVYVCDRSHNRIQVFQKDGTFVKEFYVERQSPLGGTVAEVAFSPDRAQTFMYVADAANSEVQVVTRVDGKPVTSFGRSGRMAGEFRSIHNIATDSKGNVYTAEVGTGRRVQKFSRVAE